MSDEWEIEDLKIWELDVVRCFVEQDWVLGNFLYRGNGT